MPRHMLVPPLLAFDLAMPSPQMPPDPGALVEAERAFARCGGEWHAGGARSALVTNERVAPATRGHHVWVMAEDNPIRADPRLPIDLEVRGETPHVLAYRVWTKAPGEERWVVAAEGHSEDGAPDVHSIGPFAPGTLVAWWLGIGGPPDSWFRAAVRFGQLGRALDGGERRVRGRTNSRGGAVRSGEALLA